VTQRSAKVRRRLRDLSLQLSPSVREKLRTVLIRDDRDEIAAELLR
jgi:hypothetical protein